MTLSFLVFICWIVCKFWTMPVTTLRIPVEFRSVTRLFAAINFPLSVFGGLIFIIIVRSLDPSLFPGLTSSSSSRLYALFRSCFISLLRSRFYLLTRNNCPRSLASPPFIPVYTVRRTAFPFLTGQAMRLLFFLLPSFSSLTMTPPFHVHPLTCVCVYWVNCSSLSKWSITFFLSSSTPNSQHIKMFYALKMDMGNWSPPLFRRQFPIFQLRKMADMPTHLEFHSV